MQLSQLDTRRLVDLSLMSLQFRQRGLHLIHTFHDVVWQRDRDGHKLYVLLPSTYLVSFFINKSLFLSSLNHCHTQRDKELSVAISMSTFGLGLCNTGQLPFRRVTGETGRKQQRIAVVRAEGGGGGINPEIRKNEEKVVDSVVVTELSKNITPYCRFLIFYFPNQIRILCCFLLILSFELFLLILLYKITY